MGEEVAARGDARPEVEVLKAVFPKVLANRAPLFTVKIAGFLTGHRYL